MSFKVLPFSVESPYSLSSRDVFSDDPLTQVTAKPFFFAMQASTWGQL